jgi:N-acetyl sugar amidotransferase
MIAAAPVHLDEEQVCSGCRTKDEQKSIDWQSRKKLFQALCDEYRRPDTYDCLIPVSGGKDSFWQIHTVKQYGMNPLLVTYNENNETEVGKRNIQRMKDKFGCDYFNFTPSVRVLKSMNRVGLRKMGDCDMHAHMGINSVPVQLAVKYKIPLVFWGEHGFMDLGGMYSFKDMIEYTNRCRKEHLLHGCDWEDFIGEEGLTGKDLQWAKYPSDDEIEEVGVRGIYISNYFGWNQNSQVEEMRSLYGFEVNPSPMDRTYKRDSNLNNMHDGVHDYLKYIKFGYGRCTDHVCRDIRAGKMTRDRGIDLIRQYDHVVPSDLVRWLDYVGLTRTEFEETADQFRDPRVWAKNGDGQWTKDAIWNHN